MKYGSVCSGIEAASKAWEPLGWKPAWFSEIEPFPSAVLAHHWPEITNLGDMTKIADSVRAGDVEAPDVLVGGTPCQAFSIAGLREGLSDDRGQLTLSYVELANAIDAKRRERGEQEAIIVWENVPGVLSSKDNAFGCFLAGMAGEDEAIEPGERPEAGKSNGFWRWDKKADKHIAAWPQRGCVYGRQRALAWIIKDAKYFGVAQQRRRVFLVASARKGFDPAEILFEQDIGGGATEANNVGGEGCSSTVDNCTLYRFRRTDSYIDDGVSSTLSARDYKDRRELVVMADNRVRTLTPLEYERLQGFPDGHTLIPYEGKPADDAPRYKAIGNSMAVPVMRWIGERIAATLPAEKLNGDYGGSKTPLDQRDLWRTPPALFAALDAEFCFQLDAAAAPYNALCRKFITAEQNTLETPWADYLSIPGYVWLNPPYSDITPFVKKVAAESANQIGTVMLVPADTSVGWFKEAIQTASEVRFITAGRLAFINPVTGKPVSGNNKGSMLIIWRPYPRTHCHFATVDRDELMAFGAKLLARREAA
ncbi:TPA: phage N-6-adenine-methyltransferase [Enterobacter kobei]|nr:phage N-6-adenine-methyltransferase [Enterobacter kobei]HEO9244919.1 phage N-6-adenine-methyltransferase [Enterobacter kobei]